LDKIIIGLESDFREQGARCSRELCCKCT